MEIEIIDTGTGVIILVMAALLASFLWARLVRTWHAVAAALVFPIVVSLVVYFAPVVFGIVGHGFPEGSADTAVEAAVWYFMFAMFTLPPALPVSIVATLLIRFVMRRVKSRASQSSEST